MTLERLALCLLALAWIARAGSPCATLFSTPDITADGYAGVALRSEADEAAALACLRGAMDASVQEL